MATLIADCPRCDVKFMNFPVIGQSNSLINKKQSFGIEVFVSCTQCKGGTIFRILPRIDAEDAAVNLSSVTDYLNGDKLVSDYGGALNDMFVVVGFVSLKDHVKTPPPEHLPEDIHETFVEGVACQSIDCFNAAGTMYRLCLDLATRTLLPDETDKSGKQPNKHQRRNLKPRLDWLFEQGRLSEGLQELSDCVREEGNDGAHAGNLTAHDADDLLDFAFRLLDRLYSEPKRIALAKERRAARREVNTTKSE